MKYWTLFTLRMFVRLGLLLAVFLWWHSQSTRVLVSLTSRSVAVVVNSMGIGIVDFPVPAFTPLTYELADCRTPTAAQAAFDSSCDGTAQHLPGIHYYSGMQPWGYSVMLLEHWFLCLTFLTATIATSVTWRKTPAEAEQERADE